MKKLITIVGLCMGTIVFSQSLETKARELIKVTGADKLALAGMQQFIEQSKQSNPNISHEFWDEFAKEVTSDRIIEMYVPLYTKYYTESDLDELIKFYKTPIGQKVLKVTPAIAKESMEAGGKMGGEIGQQVQERLNKKKGYQNPPPPMK